MVWARPGRAYHGSRRERRYVVERASGFQRSLLRHRSVSLDRSKASRWGCRAAGIRRGRTVAQGLLAGTSDKPRNGGCYKRSVIPYFSRKNGFVAWPIEWNKSNPRTL